MAELSGLQIFKYLPGAKKQEHTNCKECGCPTCMAFALKLAKSQVEIENCNYVPDELKEILIENRKQPQKTVEIGNLKIGGENVLYRHEKTFINQTAIAVVVDMSKPDAQEKLNRIKDFEITRVDEKLKVDLIILKNESTHRCHPELDSVSCTRHGGQILKQVQDDMWCNDMSGIITFEEFEKLPLKEIKESNFDKTVDELVKTRCKAVLEKDENYSDPVYVYFPSFPLIRPSDTFSHQRVEGETQDYTEYLNNLCAKASFYLCKYANMLVFEDFDEALIATLMTLRQNIFTDPQKPLQVEAKVYEFNNPDENSLIFMTTNFALTFFAVANELESLNIPSYLVVTPAEGMSVLTAWSAEKFTAQMVAKTLKNFDLASKVKTRQIIIPGLLSHMKEELEEEIQDFEMVIGSVEAFGIGEFVKDMI